MDRRIDSPDAPDPDRITDRAEQACEEMIDRWRRGDAVPAESLIGRWSGTAHLDEVFELVYLEFLLGEQDGRPLLEALCHRFPTLADRLRRQVALHRTIGADSEALTEAAPPVAESGSISEAAQGWPRPAGFEIERVLGQGGMGVVYQARQIHLDRPVALKMIRAGSCASADVVSRFRAEAQAIARLQHPNIVQIFSVGDLDGRPFIEMEYVGGGSLADQIAGTPQCLRSASNLLAIIARAIHEAHVRGVIHRDLKPSNVLLQPDGTPKIADFGLAKLIDVDETLALNDSMLGSPQYMAPEQASNRSLPIGPTADVYTLGVIYYEMLTGRLPFAAPTPLVLLDLVRSTEPLSPSRLRPGLPRDVETICLRCLSKEPARRYQSAAALAEDLGLWLAGKPIRARPIGVAERTLRWSRRNPAVAGLLALVLLILGASTTGMAVLWRRARAEADTSRSLARSEEKTRNQMERLSAGLTLDRGLALAQAGDVKGGLDQMARALRLNPGEDPALERATRSNIAAWLREMPHQVTEFTLPGMSTNPAIAPGGRVGLTLAADQRSLGFLDLRTWRPLAALAPRQEAPFERTAFRGDGLVAATVDRSQSIQLWDLATGRPIGTPLAHPEPVKLLVLHPDGRHLVTASGTALRIWDLPDWGLAVGPLAVETPHRAAFSPDGSMLVTVGRMSVQRRDGRTGLPIGEPIQLPSDAASVAFHPRGDRFAVGCGPYGAATHLPGETGLLVFGARTGQPLGPILPHSQTVVQVCYRPDGQFLLSGDAVGTVRAWDLQGDPVGRPIVGRGEVASLAFTFDGRHLLIGANLGIARSDDKPLPRATAPPPQPQSDVEIGFLPDGSRVNLTGDQSVLVVDMADMLVPMLSVHEGATIARISPDSRTLLTAGPDGTARLWDLQDGLPLGPPLSHHEPVTAVEFSPDGRWIATGSRDATVRIWDRAGRLRHHPIPVLHWVSALRFSPDGSRLLVTCEGSAAHLIDPERGVGVGPPQIYQDPRSPVTRVQLPRFQPDGRVALTACNDNIISCLDAATGLPKGSPWALPIEIKDIQYAPDGRTMAILAGWKIWPCDPVSGQARRAPFGEGIYTFDIAPDGRWLVTGGQDKVLHFWDMANGEPIGEPIAQFAEPIRHVAIRGRGRDQLLISCTQGGTTQLWDAATRRPLGPPRHHAAIGQPPELSPDGRYLVLNDRGVQVWPIPALNGEPIGRIETRIRARSSPRGIDLAATAPPEVTADPSATSARWVEAGAWHERIARRSLAVSDAESACWELQRAVADDPGNWYARGLLANVLGRLDRTDAASREAAHGASGRTPEQVADLEAHFGFDALRDRRWSAAEAAFTRALAGGGPDSTPLYDARARARVELADWQGAAADLRRGPWRWQLMMYDQLDLALVAGMVEDRDFFREIRQHWRERLKINPGRPRPPRVHGVIALIAAILPGAEDPEEWVRLAEGAVRQTVGDDLVRARLALGLCLIRAGRPAEAISPLTMAGKASDPILTAEVQAALALAQHELGHESEAQQILQPLDQAKPSESVMDDILLRILIRQASDREGGT